MASIHAAPSRSDLRLRERRRREGREGGCGCGSCELLHFVVVSTARLPAARPAAMQKWVCCLPSHALEGLVEVAGGGVEVHDFRCRLSAAVILHCSKVLRNCSKSGKEI